MASQLVAGLTLKFTIVPSFSVVCNAPLTAAAGTLATAANVINVKTRPHHSLGLGEENFEVFIVAVFLLFANQRQASGYAAERALGGSALRRESFAAMLRTRPCGVDADR